MSPSECWLGETKIVPIRVRGWDPANRIVINPTSSTVTVGFSRLTPSGRSTRPNTWFAASWDAGPNNQYWASILVGPSPGVVSLQAGRWRPWVRFSLGGETIIQPADDVVVMR